MHVLAVGIGRGQDRAEEAVEGGEGASHGGHERQVLLGVVADREGVVAAGAQEAVHTAAVHLVAAALPGVVGVGMGAALEVGGEPVGRVRIAGGVAVDEPSLPAVGPRQPAEVMVEGAVLHHQHDDRVERQVARAGHVDPEALVRLGEKRVGTEDGAEPRGEPPGHRGALEELPAAHRLVGIALHQFLGDFGVARVVRILPCLTALHPADPMRERSRFVKIE